MADGDDLTLALHESTPFSPLTEETEEEIARLESNSARMLIVRTPWKSQDDVPGSHRLTLLPFRKPSASIALAQVVDTAE